MKEKHLAFEEMSKLFDNDISTEDEKNRLLDHIESCEICKREYLKLQNMMRLMSQYRNCELLCKDLTSEILGRYGMRKKKTSFFKAMPAVAAIALLMLGVGFNSLWQGQPLSNDSYTKSDKIEQNSETQTVINVIAKNKATILKVTDLYVEGEIPYNRFNSLRKELGFKKVVYSLSTGTSSQMPGNIEEVAASSSPGYGEKAVTSSRNSRYIRFRVYK